MTEADLFSLGARTTAPGRPGGGMFRRGHRCRRHPLRERQPHMANAPTDPRRDGRARLPAFLLGWCDPDPDKPIEAKIAEAVARYAQKYARPANLVIVPPDTAPALRGLTVVHSPSCPRHTLFVGSLADGA